MPNFRQRSNRPELMDGEAVSQAEFAACMADLAKVNTITLARRPTLDFVGRALRSVPAGRRVTVLDVGFGAGDMLRAIHRLAVARGCEVRLVGIDLNPRSEPVARALTPPATGIEYRTGDALAWPGEERIDLVVSSLVTHHMRDGEILRFLGWMERRAQLGWLVNDLHRHWLPYYGFAVLARAMRWHAFVRHDGPLSIARAFRREDWQALLDASGLAAQADVTWRFPFRYCVERRKW